MVEVYHQQVQQQHMYLMDTIHQQVEEAHNISIHQEQVQEIGI